MTMCIPLWPKSWVRIKIGYGKTDVRVAEGQADDIILVKGVFTVIFTDIA